MSKIKIMTKGFADFTNPKEWKDCSTAVLVESKKQKIIFDPGADRESLILALKKNKINAKDINFVFISHKHLDHIINISLFPNANICTGRSIYNGIRQRKINKSVFGKDIRIINTPGHSNDHDCLLVKTRKGKILLAGDLFWWDKNEPQLIDKKSLINKKDKFATNLKQLIESRKKVLPISDWIIPGHGKMFKSPKA
ncbi:MBL fold metallo-hydrolase [Patescibacteria group bacterium]